MMNKKNIIALAFSVLTSMPMLIADGGGGFAGGMAGGMMGGMLAGTIANSNNNSSRAEHDARMAQMQAEQARREQLQTEQMRLNMMQGGSGNSTTTMYVIFGMLVAAAFAAVLWMLSRRRQ